LLKPSFQPGKYQPDFSLINSPTGNRKEFWKMRQAFDLIRYRIPRVCKHHLTGKQQLSFWSLRIWRLGSFLYELSRPTLVEGDAFAKRPPAMPQIIILWLQAADLAPPSNKKP